MAFIETRRIHLKQGVVTFRLQKRGNSNYWYANASYKGRTRTRYVGTSLPAEEELQKIGESLFLPDKDWKVRPWQKPERRPRSLDLPNPETFPPDMYPHLYEAGLSDKLEVKRLTSLCADLRVQNAQLKSHNDEVVRRLVDLMRYRDSLLVVKEEAGIQIAQLQEECTIGRHNLDKLGAEVKYMLTQNAEVTNRAEVAEAKLDAIFDVATELQTMAICWQEYPDCDYSMEYVMERVEAAMEKVFLLISRPLAKVIQHCSFDW